MAEDERSLKLANSMLNAMRSEASAQQGTQVPNLVNYLRQRGVTSVATTAQSMGLPAGSWRGSAGATQPALQPMAGAAGGNVQMNPATEVPYTSAEQGGLPATGMSPEQLSQQLQAQQKSKFKFL